MAFTTPVRNKNHLRRLARHFISRGQFRNHLLLVVCAHTALRISDILRLRWDDVYDTERGAFQTCITVTERKTGKNKTVALHPKILEALRLWYPHRRGDYLFASGRGGMAAISRVQAWRVLHEAAEILKLGIKLSAYSLRKTFGYWAWKNGVSPVVLMHIYNHSSYAITRRYLGVAQDDTDRAYLAVDLF